MRVHLHKATERGDVNMGWLKSAHSFSFGSYFNPERMGFGVLRVLNDDQVAPGEGFPTHPHRDMEIISIPLKGSLKHEDSEGHARVIEVGDVQAMSAGTGVQHSEFNASQTEEVHFLQIWVHPNKKGLKPQYDQMSFSAKERENALQLVVAPLGTEIDCVKIHQDAWFSLADLSSEKTVSYELRSNSGEPRGVYVFVIDGNVSVHEGKNEVHLSKRDAAGFVMPGKIDVHATRDAKVLLIEVPFE